MPNNVSYRIPSLVIGLLLPITVVAQEAPPLSADELAHCARQLQSLRAEAGPLNATAAEQAERRQLLARQRATLANATPAERERYNVAASSFNEAVAKFRRDLRKINDVKDRYETKCAQRPYLRNDLAALPEAQQQAMRRGSADIRIPYDGRHAPGGK